MVDVRAHTPMQSEKGQVLSGSVDELWSTATEAAKSGQQTKAAHFYTMALDSVTRGMRRDAGGFAADAELMKFNASSKGHLAQLLSERSAVHLKLGDFAAAVEDADACTRADPESERGHARLAVAHEAACSSLRVQLEACERGLTACPGSKFLVTRKWRLKKAIAEQPDAGEAPAASLDDDGSRLAAARRVADDPSDARRPMAASDLGSVLAAGSHGVARDVVQAERYLRIASEGGDTAAQRNLGLLLIELNRPEEAVPELCKAAEASDEQATLVLKQLMDEAEARAAEARKKLEAMAGSGDARAARMLAEMAVGCA
ncbi:unnamed protein product [Prorocentrum cordatum]|uniref:Uncharacterized protein n=1 Tax=Prorocentrum cordatum TaxID=2364126 RepID=A0ABN9SFL4_9DINO|nr:unnamed protein product [Polarella glacialis]